MMKNKLNSDCPWHPVVSIGRIEYINVDPVYYGLDNTHLPKGVRLISRPPAALNQMMEDGRLDISPVSATAYARNSNDWLLLPDLSISCLGRVMSVRLVSRYPFQQLDKKQVLLTDDSAAAADLVRLIFGLNRISPVFQKQKVKGPSDLAKSIGAALVIGDAALSHKWDEQFAHVWDLGEMWHDMTGLPFVFALWAVRRSFAEKYPETVSWVWRMFQASRREGERQIKLIVLKAAASVGIGLEQGRRYYKRLRYTLGDDEYRGLTAFFDGLQTSGLITRKPEPCFFKIPAEQSVAGL